MKRRLGVPLRAKIGSHCCGKVVGPIIAALLAIASTAVAAQSPKTVRPRSVSVADGIKMVRVAGAGAIDSYGGGLARNFARFSPDGKRFVFLVKKGDLEKNTNEYSMLLGNTSEVFHAPRLKRLVVFSSSSNHEAINRVTWLSDSRTILFLGEHPGERTQLYSVDSFSGQPTKLTRHPTDLESYATSRNAAEIAYVADIAKASLATSNVERNGYRVSDELLSDLISGFVRQQEANSDYATDLFVRQTESGITKRVEVENRIGEEPISLSPDGRYLVVRAYVPYVPPAWRTYNDTLLQSVIRQKLPVGIPSQLQRYSLVDLKTGKNTILLDGPISYYGSEIEWFTNSRAVVLSGVYLPLNVEDPRERQTRQNSPCVVELKIPSGEFTTISDHDFAFSKWIQADHTLELKARNADGAIESRQWFEKRQGSSMWMEVPARNQSSSIPEIAVEQGLNAPPRIMAIDRPRNREAVLMDLNPQFNELRFGRVESVKWKDETGVDVEGGIYLPPDYVKGKKYPLVIQTHGFDPQEFWIDGPFSTAFAAQTLAGHGMIVLQVPDSHDWQMRDTPREAPFMMHRFENAIDQLDRQGMIDRRRIGIAGFSQTCFYVKYFLTHSKYRISAAVVADGIDTGYFQYLAFANSIPYIEALNAELVGAEPFDGGLSIWLDRSPGFRLDKVQTPVLIQAIHPPSLLGEWEWFAGLTLLHKPVDLLYFPNGYHILQKPWERFASEQSSVDWFRFWLSNAEDSDPRKLGQYKQWHRLRDLAADRIR